MDADSFDLDQFYLSYRKAVLKAAYGMLRDWQRAEDVVQEAFLVLHQRLLEGTVITNPKAFLQSWTYYLALEQLKPASKAAQPMDPQKMDTLVDAHFDGEPSDQDPFTDLLSYAQREQDAWEAFRFWGRRIVQAATHGVPEQQRSRLYVLLDADDRPQAMERLEAAGDSWNKSSVSMTLARYSKKVDKSLRKALEKGPRTPYEERCWPLFIRLCDRCPGLDPNADRHQNTLTWFIRSINRIDPAERSELVVELFRPDPPPGDTGSSH